MNSFSEQDILDSIDLLFGSDNRSLFRHILLGGFSDRIGLEHNGIFFFFLRIREHSASIPIYLMCLPPSIDEVKQYYEAGVSEFGFNIEIFDRTIAKQLMPGKGSIPIKLYFEALKEAVRLCGSTGAVRSAFVVGLEPKKSLFQGIEALCRIGVAPILSVFRPIPGTELESMVPLTDDELYEITQEAEKICERYGLSLGPTCPACRNNTLTIAKENEVETMDSLLWRRKTI